MKTTFLIALLLIFLPTSCQLQRLEQNGGMTSSDAEVQSLSGDESAAPENTPAAFFIVDNSENPVHIQIEGQDRQDTVDGKGTTTNGIVRSAVTCADYGSCFNGSYLAEPDGRNEAYILTPAKPQRYGLLTLGVDYEDLRMEAVFLHGKSVRIQYNKSIEIAGAKDEFEFLLSGSTLKGMVFDDQVLSVSGQLPKKSKVVLEKNGQELLLRAVMPIQDLTVTIQTHDGRKVTTCQMEDIGADFRIAIKNNRVTITME